MKQIPFKQGQKYTLIIIGARCFRKEIIITQQDSNGRYIYKEKGGRKEYYVRDLKQIREKLFFAGHNLPVRLDSETNAYMVSATFNFVTDDPTALRAFLEKNCLTSFTDKQANIMYRAPNGSSDSCQPLYPTAATQD